MAKSEAATVEAYLSELPEDKRRVISEVRELILRNLPAGYEETMAWGMISYQIPLERYKDTYNGKALTVVSLAAQKNHYALYLHILYQDPEELESAQEEIVRAGKRLDLGKSCLRFRRLDDLPQQLVARLISGTTPEAFIASYEASRRR